MVLRMLLYIIFLVSRPWDAFELYYPPFLYLLPPKFFLGPRFLHFVCQVVIASTLDSKCLIILVKFKSLNLSF